MKDVGLDSAQAYDGVTASVASSCFADWANRGGLNQWTVTNTATTYSGAEFIELSASTIDVLMLS